MKKKFLVSSFLATAAIVFICTLAFELWNGPHPECGVNDSVGPCDYWGRVVFDLPVIIQLTILLWFIVLFAEVLGKSFKKRR